MLESLFNEVTGLEACNCIKKTSVYVFSFEYCKIFRNNYFKEHLRVAAFVR